MDQELPVVHLVLVSAVALPHQEVQATGLVVERPWVLEMEAELPPGVLRPERQLGHQMQAPAAMVAELLLGSLQLVLKPPTVVRGT